MSKTKATNRKRGADIRSTAGLSGVELISRERARQMSEEGWTPEHDDEHEHGELDRAAMCYLVHGNNRTYIAQRFSPASWPWDDKWWKPSEDPIRNLVKAGALISAEIDRLQRKRRNSSDRAAWVEGVTSGD